MRRMTGSIVIATVSTIAWFVGAGPIPASAAPTGCAGATGGERPGLRGLI
jgi:hypothetical protein